MSEDDDGWTPVYTDGACFNNGNAGAKAGIGVFFGAQLSHNVSRPLDSAYRQTNNTAEIVAAMEAIYQAERQGIQNLEIRTDSQFLINCIDWMETKWKLNGWRTASGKQVKNRDELAALDRAIQESQMNVRFKHVPGHKGDSNNGYADQMARNGARMNYFLTQSQQTQPS